MPTEINQIVEESTPGFWHPAMRPNSDAGEDVTASQPSSSRGSSRNRVSTSLRPMDDWPVSDGFGVETDGQNKPLSQDAPTLLEGGKDELYEKTSHLPAETNGEYGGRKDVDTSNGNPGAVQALPAIKSHVQDATPLEPIMSQQTIPVSDGSTVSGLHFSQTDQEREYMNDKKKVVAWTSDGQNDADYASIFTRTNSFPEVPPLKSSLSAQISILPNSQARDILGKEENAVQMEDDLNAAPSDLSINPFNGPIASNFPNDSDDGGEIFGNMGNMQPISSQIMPADDEARFEEGLPLVQSESSELKGSSNINRDFHLSPGVKTLSPEAQEMGFGETGINQQTLPKIGIAERKSTGQLLESMHYTPRDIAHPPLADLDESFGLSDFSGSDLTVRAPTARSQIVNEDTAPAEKKPKDEDLAEMWKAALGDDDLLEENEESLDPSSFFEDDGDGFLDDSADAAEGHPRTSDGSSSPSMAPVHDPSGKLESFNRGIQPDQARIDSYLPTESAQMRQSHSPQVPIPAHQEKRGLKNSVSTPMMDPNGTTSFGNPSLQRTPPRPPLPQPAQSFADKAKGGYTSPYDLPMDISRPKKRNLIQQNAPLTSIQDVQRRPPPPRSSSMYTGVPPRTESQPLPPTVTKSDLEDRNSRAPILEGKSSTGTFFEELPTSKQRPSTSAGKYLPQTLPSNPLQPHFNQSQPSQGSPMEPRLHRGTPPVQQSYQLVPPERMALFENALQEQSGAQQSPAVNARYSPAPSQAPNVPPPRNRYAASPAAPVLAQTLPFQPRTSSPLAQTSRLSNITSDQPPNAPSTDLQSPPYSRQATHRPMSNDPQDHYQPGIESGIVRSSSPTALNSRSAPSSDSPSSSQAIHTPETDRLSSDGPIYPQNPYDPQSQISGSQTRGPPRRSQTQSPSALRPMQEYSYNSQAKIQRPASVSNEPPPSATSPPGTGIGKLQSRNRGYSQSVQFLQPSDGREIDSLERWKGCPIVAFGFGGQVVSSFPKRIPRYAAGQKAPLIKCSVGEVKIQTAKSFAVENTFHDFPGPLRSKSKKKDVLDWMQRKIASIESDSKQLVNDEYLSSSSKRHEERLMLWKTVRILVEHDGSFDSKAAGQAVRGVLSPETISKEESVPTQNTFQNSSGISRSNTYKSAVEAPDEKVMENLRQFLLLGDRERAVWLAVDNRLWGHAMLLSSTLGKATWKQVCAEFIRQEVKAFGNNTESLAAAFQVFAGNGDESMDELVPPSARAGLQMVSKATSAGPTRNALEGLDRWRESLTLILNNRTAEDEVAIVSLGRLLASYGRVEAAHICFMFAKSLGLFGGPDDAQVSIILLGADHVRQPFEYGRDLDSILLTEVYDFASTVLPGTSVTTVSPHLQAYKLYHAMVLAEHGLRAEAQQYCDAIANALKSTTKPSPYYHGLLFGALENLGERLRQAPRDGTGSWISKPSIDKVSGSIWAKFNSYVAGEDNEASSTASGTVHDHDVGPFARVVGDSPDISRTPSSGDLHNAQYSGQSIPQTSAAAPNSMNARYAPAGLYTPRSSLEQARRPSQESPRNSLAEPKSSYIPQQFSSRPTSSTGSSDISYKPASQLPSYAPLSRGYLPTPPIQSEPSSYTLTSEPRIQSYRATEAFAEPESQIQNSAFEYKPEEVPTLSSSDTNTLGNPLMGSVNLPHETPLHVHQEETEQQPQPSSYEPPSYNPPSYEPEASYDDDTPATEKRKPLMMEEEDDEVEARAAAIRKDEKARKDRESEEAFRRAAEEDGE